MTIEGFGEGGRGVLQARRVMLAAGTLASTRLALQAINHRAFVPMQSCPTAAFMLWLRRHLGQARGAAFGLGQLSFAFNLAHSVEAFGSLFNATGIPVSEFARHMPFGKRYGVTASAVTVVLRGRQFFPSWNDDRHKSSH